MTLIDHVLRVQVRIDFGGDVQEIRTGTDLCLPAASSLSEVLDDVLALTQAPKITVPWEGFTGSGKRIDPAAPLHSQGLEQGGILTLAPTRPEPAPIAKDSAEALAHVAKKSGATRGTLDVATVAGLAALVVVLLAIDVPMPVGWRMAVLLIVGVALLAWRQNVVLFFMLIIGAGATMAWTIASPTQSMLHAVKNNLTATDGALMVACTAVAMMVMTIVAHVVKKHPLTAVAASMTISLGLVASLPGAWLFRSGFDVARHGWVFTMAGCAVAVGVAALAMSPMIASAVAGLRVPRLPSAGQDMSVSDEDTTGVDEQAERATQILDGLLVGLCVVLSAALLLVGVFGGGFAQALCLTAAASVLIHAHRHHRPVAVWALWILGLVALMSAAIATNPHSAVSIVITVVVCLVLATAPVWAHKIPRFEPTTVVWIERAESLCVAATVPLALHIAGLFILIRGLG